jgi:rhodanese-related sulfurtransferase
MKYFIVLIASFVLSACGGKSDRDQAAVTAEQKDVQSGSVYFNHIDIKNAKALINQNKDLILLDVRTPGEIAQGKIADAVEMDFQDPGFLQSLDALNKDKEYLVYCAVGGRSANAMEMMKSKGFKKVHNLAGGYSAWYMDNK